MVSIDKIERGAASFLDQELLPSMPITGGKKVLVGVGAGVLLKGYMQQLRDLMKNEIAAGAGVVDQDGNVNLEMIRDEVMRRTSDEGMDFHVNVPFIGAVDMKFHRSDIEKLYQHIMMQ